MRQLNKKTTDRNDQTFNNGRGRVLSLNFHPPRHGGKFGPQVQQVFLWVRNCCPQVNENLKRDFNAPRLNRLTQEHYDWMCPSGSNTGKNQHSRREPWRSQTDWLPFEATAVTHPISWGPFSLKVAARRLPLIITLHCPQFFYFLKRTSETGWRRRFPTLFRTVRPPSSQNYL